MGEKVSLKPYYENENGKLYHGDCLEIMPKLGKVDLVLTDPPYGINFQSNYRREKHPKIENDNNLDWLSDFFLKVSLLIKEDCHSYFFGPYQIIDRFLIECRKHLSFKNLLIWEKNNAGMGDLSGDYAPKYEPIIFCSNGKLKLNGGRDSNILKFNKTGNDMHPTQKPVTMFQYFVGKSTKKNELVFDPFFGSGTTGIACEEIGRKWIGIEREEKYCEIAAKRIEAENRQLKLF